MLLESMQQKVILSALENRFFIHQWFRAAAWGSDYPKNIGIFIL